MNFRGTMPRNRAQRRTGLLTCTDTRRVLEEIDALTPLVARPGVRRSPAARVVADLAHPVDVVDADLPVQRLELVFRSVHVGAVAVRDGESAARVGLITRPRFTAAMAGRLGFGRAVLARKVTGELADWAPLVVDGAQSVSQVAVRAMERGEERRYDDVLVSGDQWRVAPTADLVRSLSEQLAARTLHDPLTGVATRPMLQHALARRCSAAVGTPARVVVVVVEVRDLAAVNRAWGGPAGDAVLAAVGARLVAAGPPGVEPGRVSSARFAVVATLPGTADDAHAAHQAAGLRDHLAEALRPAPAGLDPAVWPGVRAAVVCSAVGGDDPDRLLLAAEDRLRLARAVDRVPEPWAAGHGEAVPSPAVPSPAASSRTADGAA